MAISIKKIAEIAGCSPQAVSAVFKNNSTTRVSDSLREKVLAIAAELGYVPNRLSSALRKKRSGIIALILPWDVPEIMDVVNMEAEKYGFKVLTLFTHCADHVREAEALDAALAYQVDGLIWTPFFDAGCYLPQLARLRQRNTPLVYLTNRLAELPGDFVGNDLCGGIKTSVDHLRKCGYKKLYYITLQEKFPPRDIRKEFFLEYTGRQGILIETTGEKMVDISGIDHTGSGIIADDFAGLKFIHEFHQAQMRIPEDAGVIIFKDHLIGGVMHVSEIMVPRMTSCRCTHDELSRHAVELLMKRIETPDMEYTGVVLPMRFTVRNSTSMEGDKIC